MHDHKHSHGSCSCHSVPGTYRAFVLRDLITAPQTILTFSGMLLLLVGAIQQPEGIVSSHDAEAAGTKIYLAAALAASIYIWWSALQGIRKRVFTADIPVALATVGAIAIGQYSAAAVVAVLLLIGGLLESLVAARANKAMEKLATLLPAQANIRRAGKDLVIPISEIVVGDILLVRAGERIAADGEVIAGSARVNESAITGESRPVEKVVGNNLYAGSYNEAGILEVCVSNVGSDTMLGQIRKMIEHAREHTAPIERLLDRYARYYTPGAIIAGALLWWWSGELFQAVTMLIVFCPCVLALATPTALVAAVGNAAMRGSLIKKSATIEKLSRIDTVIFDKTGTLTTGELELSEIIPAGNFSADKLLECAAVAEKFSEHTIGKSIRESALKRKFDLPDPDNYQALPGLGIKAQFAENNILLGNTRLLKDFQIEISMELDRLASDKAEAGNSVIWMAVNNEIAGLLIFSDEIRVCANKTIAHLHDLGLRTIIVSGDSQSAVGYIAARLGITTAQAEMLPQQKVEIVRSLQSDGKKVLFVGDGINDGPALSVANVGVAMGLTGTDVTIETAEIVLLSDDLDRLPYLTGMARSAVSVIKQNIFFTLFVLVGAIGLTVAGVLTPVTGALLHELSSIPIILNAARLIAYRQNQDKSGVKIAFRKWQRTVSYLRSGSAL